jgi:hypothetical protein
MEDSPVQEAEKFSTVENNNILARVKDNISEDENSIEPAPRSVQTVKMPRKQLSQAQIDHLKYARECKKLKSAGRDLDRETTNNNLDFIYRRLTNIENQMRSMADPSQPIVKGKQPAPIRIGKRKTSDKPTKEEVEDEEDIKVKKQKKGELIEKTTWETAREYATRGLLLFGAGVAFNLAKRYISYGTAPRTTQDGDQVNSYYLPQDI